jgi:hypothetical protein
LNPEYFNDKWCHLDKIHIRSIGGRIELNGQEAEDYLADVFSRLNESAKYSSGSQEKKLM